MGRTKKIEYGTWQPRPDDMSAVSSRCLCFVLCNTNVGVQVTLLCFLPFIFHYTHPPSPPRLPADTREKSSKIRTMRVWCTSPVRDLGRGLRRRSCLGVGCLAPQRTRTAAGSALTSEATSESIAAVPYFCAFFLSVCVCVLFLA